MYDCSLVLQAFHIMPCLMKILKEKGQKGPVNEFVTKTKM